VNTSSDGFPPSKTQKPARIAVQGSTWQIITYTYFTFVVYLSVGLPLAVLPPYVHLRMGYSAALAGLVISIQYIATLASRPWAGRISDKLGAKVSVLWGMGGCAVSGALLIAAAAFHSLHWLCMTALIVSRLALGIGESLGSTGSTLWGISAAGPEYTAKVISFNGVSTYGAMALGAPLGVVIESACGSPQWGLAAIGLLILLVGGFSLALANHKQPVAVEPGKHLSFRAVISRVAPHGLALALGGIGYSALATFVTLFYLSRHWTGAALCLTAFGLAFVAARLLLIQTINRWGGFPVAMASLIVESLGLLMLWRSGSPWTAFWAAAITGFGFSLVFPALGVEAVKRVNMENRGAALGIFTAFADVSFFLVGPVAGAIIGLFGYASVFLFALISVLAALAIVMILRRLSKLAGYSY
jgi:MFS family permease